jgi:hypothetical protein
MTPWMLDVKFPPVTQFTFESLTFAAGEDGDIRMLPQGPAPERLTLAYGQAPWSPVTSSTSCGACLGLDPFAGCYIRTAKLVLGIPVVTSILWPSAGALSSSSSVASPDQDSSDDYPEIGMSTCGDSAREGCFIFMVAPNGDPFTIAPADIPPLGDRRRSMPERPMLG